MKKIKIEVTSRILFLLDFLLLMTISAALMGLLKVKFPELINKLVFIIGAFLIWYLMSKFTKRYKLGIVILKVNDKGLNVNWEKQLAFRRKPDAFLKWEEIYSFKCQPEQYLNVFKVKLTNGKKYKFTFEDKQYEFHRFFDVFEKIAANKSNHSSNINIKKEKTIYESTYGKVMAVIVILLILFMIWTVVFGETKKEPNYGMLLISLSGSIFFVLQVYTSIKK